jgi:FtsP/CotA-like multicopper oxidase with cupredoxin domain
MHFCYLLADGTQAPTLRLNPGDLLLLHLKNALVDREAGAAIDMPSHDPMMASMGAPCGNGAMTALSTNLHFHGLTIPPLCHQDDVLKTLIQPGDPAFEYRIRIPPDEPPGLYWYHPHVHGYSKLQVLGGASGALIVEGIERANAAVANLPERVLIVRDQDLLHPDAPPAKSEPVVP